MIECLPANGPERWQNMFHIQSISIHIPEPQNLLPACALQHQLQARGLPSLRRPAKLQQSTLKSSIHRGAGVMTLIPKKNNNCVLTVLTVCKFGVLNFRSSPGIIASIVASKLPARAAQDHKVHKVLCRSLQSLTTLMMP